MAKTIEAAEFELYNGKVQVKFQPNPYHRYYITDEEKGLKKQYTRGVTTWIGIMDKSIGLVTWATEIAALHLLDAKDEGQEITDELILEAVNMHKQFKKEAADIGTLIHEWCEGFIRYKLGEEGYEKPELPDAEKEKAVRLGAEAFLQWVIEHKVNFISTEQVVYSRTHGFVGTVDIIAEVDGRLAVVDLKSSNGLYNSVRLQTAAYAAAYMEEFPEQKILDRWAIRLAKEDEAEYYEREERKCYIRGKDTNGIQEYAPVEWIKFEGEEAFELDFAGFINAKGLSEWNDATDFYKNRKSINICRPSTKQSSLAI